MIKVQHRLVGILKVCFKLLNSHTKEDDIYIIYIYHQYLKLVTEQSSEEF